MNNVICVYTGTKYNINHVNVLYNMVERNLSQPFNFYCLTNNQGQKFHKSIKLLDVPEPVMENWWNKMHLYNKELNIEGNILYMDLDVVVISSLDEFFTNYSDDKLCVIRDFGQPKSTINSSVLRYNLKHHHFIWDNYIKKKQRYDGLHGDQNVLTDMIYSHEKTVFLPDEWTYSFKWPERGKPKQYQKYKPEDHPLKKNAKICVFHGHPNPDYAMEYDSGKWIKDYWK
jgi:hypothetical protein